MSYIGCTASAHPTHGTEAGWYVLVAVAMSAPRLRQRYLCARTVIDRAAGLLLAALRVRLLLSSR